VAAQAADHAPVLGQRQALARDWRTQEVAGEPLAPLVVVGLECDLWLEREGGRNGTRTFTPNVGAWKAHGTAACLERESSGGQYAPLSFPETAASQRWSCSPHPPIRTQPSRRSCEGTGRSGRSTARTSRALSDDKLSLIRREVRARRPALGRGPLAPGRGRGPRARAPRARWGSDRGRRGHARAVARDGARRCRDRRGRPAASKAWRSCCARRARHRSPRAPWTSPRASRAASCARPRPRRGLSCSSTSRRAR